MPDRIEALRGMLLQDPANSRVRHMLANELGNAGKLDDALAEYDGLTAADPDYVPGYFQAGRLAEQHGRTELARTWYERGLANAQRTGDRHAANEIQAALDLLS
jgi:tetratricopeptide (TPR) repeat protein